MWTKNLLAFTVVSACLLMAGTLDAGSQPKTSDTLLEVTNAQGRQLFALPDDDTIQTAAQALAKDPKNVALILKLSKAKAARRQYREAVVTCTQGLAANPNSTEIYLERGHRELGLREFERALDDLNRAVQLNPKLLEAQYHQGMAHYFLRQYDGAVQGFGRALALAKTSDDVIDCSNWLYVSLRRAGHPDEAARVLARIGPGVKNQEPHLYFYLRLLRFYQGSLTEKEVLPHPPAGPDDIEGELSFNTVNYGVGNWHFYNNDPAGAQAFFKRVVTGSAWNSWGFIASERELAAAAK